MFENSNRSSQRLGSGFNKPEPSSRSSFRPIRDDKEFDPSMDKEHDAGSKIVSEERAGKSGWGSEMLKEGDTVNVKATSIRSQTTQSSPHSTPITETTRTNVSCIATPTVDRNGKPVIETITKTVREVNGQALPAETIRSKIPLEEIQALQQGQQQPLLEGGESSSSTSADLKQKGSELKGKAQQAASTASARGSEMMDQAKVKGNDMLNQAKPMMNQAKERGTDMLNQAKEQAQPMMDQAKVRGTEMLNQAKEQAPVLMNQAKEKSTVLMGQAQERGTVLLNQAKEQAPVLMEQAKVAGTDMLHQAQDLWNENAPKAQAWVEENAPKAKEALNQGAAVSREWVETNAPKAKEMLAQGAQASREWVETTAPKVQTWVQINAPKARTWVNQQYEDLRLAASRIDTRQLKAYLPRKELLPLLASALLALALGVYLFRNAGHLGLKQNNEALVPLTQQPAETFTILPQTRDYYQNEHVPRRVEELQVKAEGLKERAKAGLHQASKTIRSTAEQAQDAAMHAAHLASEKAMDAKDFVSEKAGELSEQARLRAEEAKGAASQMGDKLQHEARRVQSEAEIRSRDAMHHGEKAWEQGKDSAADMADSAKAKINGLKGDAANMAEQAKLKLNQAKGSAAEMADQAKAKMGDAADMTKQHLNAAGEKIQGSLAMDDINAPPHAHTYPSTLDSRPVAADLHSAAGQGPYDEVNTPPHSHTYPHTLQGATEYVKDKMGEGLHAMGKRSAQGLNAQAEPLR